ncbi:hypothetical protein PMIN06_007452 [Paraphaeosphaeria minitans]
MDPAPTFAAIAVSKSNDDNRVQPWKSYNLGKAENGSVEWLNTNGKVNALTNAFQI